MELVIMAAGMGSRFGGLKQVEPVGPNGEFILDYSIYDAKRVGIDKVVFIIKEENYDLFRDTVGKRIEGKINVEYVFQRTTDFLGGFEPEEERRKPWGTAQAILACKDVVKDNFIVINADDFYGYESFKIVKDYMEQVEKTQTDFCMAGYIVKNTLSENGKVKRGICKAQKDTLNKIVESNIGYEENKLIATNLVTEESFEVKENDLVSMNFFGFTPVIFEELQKQFKLFLEKNKQNINNCEYLIPEVIQKMISANKCSMKVLKTNAVWHGVTYKEDKEELQKAIFDLIEKKEYPSHLWK